MVNVFLYSSKSRDEFNFYRVTMFMIATFVILIALSFGLWDHIENGSSDTVIRISIASVIGIAIIFALNFELFTMMVTKREY